MGSQPEKRPELIEAETQLRRIEREIESAEKDLLAVREKLRVEEQKEIDSRAGAGRETTPFEPSPEMANVLKAIAKGEDSLELLRLKESEHRKRLRHLEREGIEAELIEISKVTIELSRREQELSAELDHVRKELSAAQARSTELADRIAAQSQD